MPQVDPNSGSAKTDAQSGRGRLLKTLLLIIAVIAAGLALWFFDFGKAIVGDATKRNQRDLAIAASGLETWSDSIRAVAVGNFIRGRVGAIDAGDRDRADRWTHRVRIRHPMLGEYKILYRIGTIDDCKAIAAQDSGLPFVRGGSGGGQMLKVLGRFPVADIWRQDMLAEPGQFDVVTGRPVDPALAAYLRNILNTADVDAALHDPIASPDRALAVAPGRAQGPLQICYGAVIPLDRLLVIDRAARDFSNLLVVDASRRIVAQVGSEPIPVSSLDGLVPNSSVLVDTLAATAGQPARVQPRQQALGNSLEPVDVDLGDKTMVAYVRPFYPAVDGFPACAPPGKDAGFPRLSVAVSTDGGASTASAPLPDTAASAGRPPPATGQCIVVGLMPKTAVWQQIATPPLMLVVGFGLVVGIALTLLPSVRLLLLGPREAIGRIEAVGVALGIPAAISLATLVVLFVADVAAHRNAAATMAGAIASDAAATGFDYLGKAAARAKTVSDTVMAAGPVETVAQQELESGLLKKPAPSPRGYAAKCIAALAKDDGIDRYVTVGAPVMVDPRPLRCTTTDICTGDDDRSLRPPLVEAIGHFGTKGSNIKGSRTIACRSFSGGRAQLLGRDYFQRLLRDDPSFGDGSVQRCVPGAPCAATPYVLDQVVALPDGISKTIIAFRANDPRPGWYASTNSQDSAVYAVSSTVMTDLVTPAVLPPFQMMVVDTRDERLPVILHQAPNRAGAERLATMFDRPDEVRHLLRELVADGGTAQPRGFQRFYEGGDRYFVAAPIRNSRWVVLVYYAAADIDAAPSRTARYAITNWAVMSVVFAAGWILWLGLVGRHGMAAAIGADKTSTVVAGPASPVVAGQAAPGRIERLRAGLWPLLQRWQVARLFNAGWPRLWPNERRSGDYVWLRRAFLWLALAGLLLLVLVMATGVSSILALIGMVLVRVAAGLVLHWRLGDPALSPAVPANRAMTPATQTAYRKLAMALILCLSVLPMIGFWWDARSLAQVEGRHELLMAIDGHDGIAQQADRGLERIWWAYGQPAGENHGRAKSFGFVRDGEAPDARGATERPGGTFVATVFDIAGRAGDNADVFGCALPADATMVRLCGPGGSGRGIAVRSPTAGDIGATAGISLLLLITALAFGLNLLLKRVLRALCGFSIAIEAVDYPRLYIGSLWTGAVAPQPGAGEDFQTLNRKSLLVNAPWSIRPMLELLCEDGAAGRLNLLHPRHGPVTPVHRTIKTFDLSGLGTESDGLPGFRVYPGQIILVTGLDLVLADGSRRIAALAALEDLVRQVDARTTDEGECRDPYLLFLAPSAPMDRILDAYEREHPDTASPDIKRENMRWARLFEDFATFQFRPIELTQGRIPDGVTIPDVHQHKAIRAVFEELRWMSPRVVNGCINDEIYPRKALLRLGLLPVRDPATPDDSPFIALYETRILRWAQARKFPGRQAALSYIRSQFIEHYQRLWSSSTLAERLVMHHLAFGRFVNIQTSLGFASLVRRGLVVLDPDPRLMNESFAMFVRQAEKLDRIREWQGSLPGSAWVRSRLPIFIVLGLAIAALAAMAVLAGQDVRALLPLMVTGVPALFAATQRLFRPS